MNCMDFFVFRSQNLNASALLLCNYLGVDMGEERALEESIADYTCKHAFLLKDVYPLFAGKVACLHSFYADNVKYIHLGALCYNKRKLGSALEAALKVKSMLERKTHDS